MATVRVLIAAALLTLASAAVADGRVTLGSKRFYAPESRGFGTVRPKHIFNGGDPSGDIENIHWRSWGGGSARGHGRNPIFRPSGGYYAKPVRIELWARKRGRCPGEHHLAYRQLWFREPSRPGGPLGRWTLWSGAHDLCASSP